MAPSEDLFWASESKLDSSEVDGWLGSIVVLHVIPLSLLQLFPMQGTRIHRLHRFVPYLQ